ncbi:hypothetical protein AM228_02385 [Planktothricoides sp. SR001]|nr:hypothetical protein AM228_02385 [Planktothricoides sp. SR001]
MDSTEQKLSELMNEVTAVSPQLADFWQATAIIESLGYTDRIIQKEFGFPDALSVGKYIYDHQQREKGQKAIAPPVRNWRTTLEDFRLFLQQFSRSFVYTLPLVLIVLLEYFHIKSETSILPAQLASLITLSTITSLCTSGGFVQIISRRGEFYTQINEPLQAQRVCLLLLYLGMTTTIILSLIGLFFGLYRGLVADEYLILSTWYYLLLSILWMLLAFLSIQLPWSPLVILLGLSALFLVFRLALRWGSLEAQIVAMFITLVIVAILVVWLTKHQKLPKDNPEPVELPKVSATTYLLMPYFCYGIGYFCFIFADRIVAGIAINPAYGIIFAIDSFYQRQMDLALLNFLLMVPFVEYFSYIFIRFWYQAAKQVAVKNQQKLAKKLFIRYWLIVTAIIIVFATSVTITINLFKPATWDMEATLEVLLGCLGYLFLVIAILNAILLFSLNQGRVVFQTLLPSLVLNFTVGYILAHTITVACAVIGLIIGAAMFMLLSGQKVFQAIAHLNYAYYVGGY